MNKKVLLLILIFVLLASAFAFASCQNQLEIESAKSVVGIDITRKVVSAKYDYQNDTYCWVIKYYVDPLQCDLSTVNSIKIKAYIPKYDNYGNLNEYPAISTINAIIPDDVAPTAENNYFYVELDNAKYDPSMEREFDPSIGDYADNFKTDDQGVKHYFPSENLVLKQCFFYVDDNSGDASDDNPMDNITKIPSIGLTFVLGIVMVVVGFVLYWIALTVFQNKLAIAIAFSVPLILTIGSWILWGWARGLIMTVFFVIYYVCIETFAKRVADTLGY
ncbi:MAG: hypothetical protein IJX23_02725 [Clostridia bacterium]|nr:hypothetical protein [Clostridia bacterium]